MRHLRNLTLALCASALSGCSVLGLFGADPLDDVEKLSDVALAPEVESAALIAPADEVTVLQSIMDIFRGTDEAEVLPTAIATDIDVAEDGEMALTETDETAETDMPIGVQPLEEDDNSSVFGFLVGLFPDLPNETADLVAEVAIQLPPAFGDLRAACDVQQSELGTEIATASGYTIYDTLPGTTALRPHYITGLRDRCPRRFDAALVFLGDIGTHELVRYAQTGVRLDYSATDEAYEGIKASYCGAERGAPCGDRLDRLARDTTFVTAYETFGAAPKWAEFLLHRGEVAATDIEG